MSLENPQEHGWLERLDRAWRKIGPWAFSLMIFSLLFQRMSQPAIDPDVFWHLTTGEWILDHRTIPRTDPFSWTMNGQPWTAHEWASEVVYALAYRLAGPLGMTAIGTLAVCGGLFFLVRVMKRSAGSFGPAGMAVVVATTLVVRDYLELRPFLFSYFFLGLALDLITSRRYRRLPLLGVVWANFHGMFVLLPLLLGVHGIACLLDHTDETWRDKGWVKRWGLSMMGVVLSPLLTPHGLGLYHYVWQTLTYRPFSQHINEWLSPNFTSPLSLVFLGLILGVIGLSWCLKERLSAWEIALWAIFTAGALKAVRNIPLYYLTMAPVYHRLLTLLPKPANAYLVDRRLLLSAFYAWACAMGIYALAMVENPLPTEHPYQPHESVAYLKAHPELKRVVNSYNFGGFLIRQGVPVFVDGRADIYMGEVFEDAMSLDNFTKWEGILDKYEADAVMWQPHRPLAAYLSKSPKWQKVVDTDAEVLFVRVAD